MQSDTPEWAAHCDERAIAGPDFPIDGRILVTRTPIRARDARIPPTQAPIPETQHPVSETQAPHSAITQTRAAARAPNCESGVRSGRWNRPVSTTRVPESDTHRTMSEDERSDSEAQLPMAERS
jgi:hypothetical protein